MIPRRRRGPPQHGGRLQVGGILAAFAVVSLGSVAVSVVTTGRTHHSAAVIQVAARQRTLAERYVSDVLLQRAGRSSDPSTTADVLSASGLALTSGGLVPGVNGDDDGTSLPAATDANERAQLGEERRVISDLIATGQAILAGQPVATVPLTAGEESVPADPDLRLRVLAALTANVAQNASRTVAANADRQVTTIIHLQVALGVGALAVSLVLGWLLIVATRRQTGHFRTLIRSSTDLIVILDGAGECRYASPSVARLTGCPVPDLLGGGFLGFVSDHDSEAMRSPASLIRSDGRPFRFAVRAAGDWRQVEATVTDLRADRDVHGVVVTGRDITDRVALEDQLTHQAFHDSLTGLANRALLRDRLEHALHNAARHGTGVAVLLADLDGFKQVNDTLGHGIGDDLLVTIAHRFCDLTRAGDTLARLGGDEFAVILEGTDERDACAVAQRIVLAAAAAVPVADQDVFVSASVGVALSSGPGFGPDEIVRQADVAMYAAKRAGRGRYQMFHPELATDAGDLLSLDHEIRAGLARGEFVLNYQPEVDLHDQRLRGVEALMRWHSPTRGLVGPAAFIPAAESTTAILALGEFALAEACAQTGRWQREVGVPEDFITWVNVSAKQLAAGGIRDIVQNALELSGVAGHHLGIELTETSLVADEASIDHACGQLEELHALGVKLAIDDFGTGYSSLSHLRRFPADVLKIDRSFVAGLEHPGKEAVITANTISLAHALGLVAVAEGVETMQQLQELQRLGCDLAQGYLFARPTSSTSITSLLQASAATQSHAPGSGHPLPTPRGKPTGVATAASPRLTGGRQRPQGRGTASRSPGPNPGAAS